MHNILLLKDHNKIPYDIPYDEFIVSEFNSIYDFISHLQLYNFQTYSIIVSPRKRRIGKVGNRSTWNLLKNASKLQWSYASKAVVRQTKLQIQFELQNAERLGKDLMVLMCSFVLAGFQIQFYKLKQKELCNQVS